LKISIVTPSYNQCEFIEESVRSVISQKGDFFIDYIIVDGGSTDNSIDVIKKYDALVKEGKWPVQCRGIRYRWHTGPDNGQSDAINKGLGMAEGDIAAWLNSDDYYLPGAFASAVKAFEKDEALAMIYGNGEIVDKSGSRKTEYDAEPVFDLWKLIHLYDFILQPSVFMRRQALKRAGNLNEKLHYIMDWELWIRLSRFGKVGHLPQRLSCARVYPEAKTQSSGMNRWREIRWCSKRYGHLKLPPVILTQLIHGPINAVFRGAHNREAMIFSALVKILKKAYYGLIGGTGSGVYIDGCVERTGFLSVPLTPEIAKLTIVIQPLCPAHLRYFINNKFAGAIALDRDRSTIEVAVTGDIRKSDFLHIRFLSDKDVDIGPLPVTAAQRKGSFLIKGISLQKEDGSDMKDLGLPGFQGV
jgi:glycosyltransferase involved in cell wall biosynthesis